MPQTVQCTACGGSCRQDPFKYDWRDRQWWIYRCTVCTLQFVWPQVTDDDRAAIFGDDYFRAKGDWACGWWGASYEDAEQQLRDEARQVLALLGTARGRMLDVGCAGGIFLDEARSAGWSVAGVEFNATMAERARSRGIAVWQGAIEAAPLGTFAEPFDAVVVMDTLEHVPDPRGAMERIGAWTGPGSSLLIRGPLNNDGLARAKERLRRLLRKRKTLPGYPLDANTWNPKALRLLVERAGFRVTGWHSLKRDFGNLLAVRENGVPQQPGSALARSRSLH